MHGARIAIVGSRTFGHEALDDTVRESVRNFVDKLDADFNVVVSGRARGVDSWAEERAKERGIPTAIHIPLWEKYGKSAGFKRNKLIVADADSIVAFWDCESKGTEHTIKLAVKAGKPVAIFGPMGELVRYIVPEHG